MNFENDFALEPADCSLEAKYVCVKSVCPQGFEWYDSKSCVKLMDTTASKSNAMSSCRNIHPRASLLTPKSANDQMVIKNYLKRKSFTDSLFLGAEMNENGHWHWDDGNPLFVSGNILKYYIFSLQNVFIKKQMTDYLSLRPKPDFFNLSLRLRLPNSIAENFHLSQRWRSFFH